METRISILSLIAAAILLATGCGSQREALLPTPTAAEPPRSATEERSVERLSKVYDVDRIYRSMTGPYEIQELRLLENEEPELLWLTGYHAVVVGGNGETQMPQDYMCHTNLDWDPTLHNEIFGWKLTNPRLFSISQGQASIEFPPGFGIPMLSTEALTLTTQVLNLNEPEGSRQVRHRVRVDFVRDRDLERPYKPLFFTSAFTLVSLEGQPLTFGVKEPSAEQQHASCLPGIDASEHPFIFKDGHGRRFTGHFVVKPGRHEYRTLSTRQMNLPYDTTIHYINVHLHPFAESLELLDLTTGETVYRSDVKNYSDRIGLEHVDSYSSEEGIPVYKDHEYELVSVYNNTSSEDQDAMATFFLYYLDKGFEKPKLSKS